MLDPLYIAALIEHAPGQSYRMIAADADPAIVRDLAARMTANGTADAFPDEPHADLMRRCRTSLRRATQTT